MRIEEVMAMYETVLPGPHKYAAGNVLYGAPLEVVTIVLV